VPTIEHTGATMSAAASEIARQFYETVFRIGDVGAVDEYLSADFLDHAPWPGQAATRDGFRTGVMQMRAAFPDLSIEPVRIVEEGGKVAALVRVSGTQHGEFFHHPATGRAFGIDAIDILRIEDGKLIEHWGVMDVNGMLAQLRLSMTQ
jgi:steroid delta-isomerase-like uncharacterized protein